MKILPIICILICSGQIAQAQSKVIDSLSRELSKAPNGKQKVLLLSDIGYYYRLSKPDTAFIISQQALALAKQIKYAQGEANAFSTIGSIYRMVGDLQSAMSNQYESQRIGEKYGFKNELAKTYLAIGIVYSDLKEYDLAIGYVKRASKMYEILNNTNLYNTALANLGEVYYRSNQLDCALHYLQIAHKNLLSNNRTSAIWPFTFSRIGMVQLKLKNYAAAYDYAQKAIVLGKQDKNIRVQIKGNQIISEYYQASNKLDSAIYFAQKAFDLAKTYDYKWDILENSNLLANLYEQKDFKQAYYYTKYSKQLNDSLNGVDRVNALQKRIIQEQNIVREKEANALAYQNQMKQNMLLLGLGIAGIIGFILYRNNRQKQKANILLREQHAEIQYQRTQLQESLESLKSTQTQLIQKEKLASLGELTAGIAHEIQNPLNFVNNFSEMSVELAQELKEETEKSEIDKELIIDLAKDLAQNQQKINHHGKRASSIVSNMLEHSRTSTGERALTDLNQLTDEYLRLSYHGIRTKDSNFNSDYKTDFDENLPKIEVIPQDMGRVLLNLINNAFWAVSQRNHVETGHALSLPTQYQPTVIVSTQYINNQIIISVKDNGIGISADVLPKIFQPFFTTKPTGQGTGLGLSLSYDIITKGHGGTLEVDSVEGKGTTFIVKLPINA